MNFNKLLWTCTSKSKSILNYTQSGFELINLDQDIFLNSNDLIIYNTDIKIYSLYTFILFIDNYNPTKYTINNSFNTLVKGEKFELKLKINTFDFIDKYLIQKNNPLIKIIVVPLEPIKMFEISNQEFLSLA